MVTHNCPKTEQAKGLMDTQQKLRAFIEFSFFEENSGEEIAIRFRDTSGESA
jgi:hypothetical protein